LLNLAIIFALGSMTAGTLVDFIYRYAQSKGIVPTIFLFWQSLMFIASLWAIGLSNGELAKIEVSGWIFGPPSGFLTYLSLILFVKSLKSGHSSVNTPIFRLSFVVTAIGAILFLGESINVTKILGIVFAIFSIVILGNLVNIDKFLKNKVSMNQVLMGMFAAGISGIIVKGLVDQGMDSFPIIMAQTPGFLFGSAGYTLLTRQWKPNKITFQFAPITAFLQLAWTILIVESLQYGDASVTFPIVHLSFVLTAILAIGILREPPTIPKFVGLGLASLSVLAFTFL